MRAFTVCVEYDDYLALTLHYNQRHFKEIIVITSPQDTKTLELCEQYGIKYGNISHYITTAFYRNGAAFNKYLAIEEAYDAFGRHGWICNLDADIVIPDRFTPLLHDIKLRKGNLYGPYRRMLDDTLSLKEGIVPPESQWRLYKLHRNTQEWPGYMQVFHADDIRLGNSPWHQIDWTHAGAGDSYFQNKWPSAYKYRLPFDVLHLGPNWKNWYGRCSAYIDGTLPPNAQKRAEAMQEMMKLRAINRDYRSEKIPRILPSPGEIVDGSGN